MEPIPVRTRERIITLYDEGEQTGEIAEQVGYCPAAVRRIRQHFRQRGTVQPMTYRCGAKGKLTEAVKQRLRELVQQKPDATLAELREGLADQVQVSIASVDRWLRKLKLPLKKSP